MATRLLLGALTIVTLSAVAALALISGEIGSVKTAISQNPSLNLGAGTLAPAPSGAPQTLLLVGDDRRALTQYYHRAVASHSNEMLLVRFDPSKPWISMLSIPRELWVPIIPDNGAPPLTNRINFAYTLGGSQLMTETIKRVLGLSVNHVIVIDFGHFKHAIDEMGCVYSTIDHRYYHSNVGSVEQYQEINLQPGYQKLCGAQALQFVSYRHGDTSLVRDARNQAFLLDVKKQFGPSLFANRHRFEQIFGQAVETDPALHTTSGLLDLLTLFAQSAGRPVRQVHFQANLGPSFDTATPQQIQSTVNLFLHGNPVQPQMHTAAVARAVGHRVFRGRLPLVGTPSAALTAARSAARGLPFPLEYPRLRNQLPGAAGDAVRVYAVRDPQGTVHSAYVVVIDRGQLGQFYDVQGMRWSGAPMFDRPDQTVTAGGRSYQLYYEGANLKMVAWHEFGAVYWVRNTLTDDVGNTEMLAIAEQTSPLAARTAGPGRARAYLGAFGLPARPAAQPAGGDLAWLGAAASVLAILGMAFLARRLLAGRADLAALRAQIPVALMLDAQARAFAATHGVSLGGARPGARSRADETPDAARAPGSRSGRGGRGRARSRAGERGRAQRDRPRRSRACPGATADRRRRPREHRREPRARRAIPRVERVLRRRPRDAGPRHRPHPQPGHADPRVARPGHERRGRRPGADRRRAPLKLPRRAGRGRPPAGPVEWPARGPAQCTVWGSTKTSSIWELPVSSLKRRATEVDPPASIDPTAARVGRGGVGAQLRPGTTAPTGMVSWPNAVW
ncbi:MAG TPA: LCP family protein [Solirubrobacteraceae bacterium]|nr:LCP family protein [Solirubrobacteraceae bacterium]